jgi:hypothetical protein
MQNGTEIVMDGAPAEVAERYSQAIRDLYWKEKNVSAVATVGQQALNYCLEHKLFDSAKSLAYNVASFCWPGWNEPGIQIDEDVLRAGAEIALLNLRLAEQLNRPALGMSMAHWLLGAYSLAIGRLDEATGEFTRAVDFARLSDDQANVFLNEGYLALIQICLKQQPAHQSFDRAVQSLEALGNEHGHEFARQLRTARQLFASEKSS